MYFDEKPELAFRFVACKFTDWFFSTRHVKLADFYVDALQMERLLDGFGARVFI